MKYNVYNADRLGEITRTVGFFLFLKIFFLQESFCMKKRTVPETKRILTSSDGT